MDDSTNLLARLLQGQGHGQLLPGPTMAERLMSENIVQQPPSNNPLSHLSLIGMLQNAGQAIQTPGRIMAGDYNVTPEVPGQWSEGDEFRAQHAAQQMRDNASSMAGLLMTGGIPFAGRGTLGMAGGAPPAPRSNYVQMLDEALHKDAGAGFPAIFEQIKGLPVGEQKAIAKEWVGTSASSGVDALKKIWNRHQNMENHRARTRAMAGRVAG